MRRSIALGLTGIAVLAAAVPHVVGARAPARDVQPPPTPEVLVQPVEEYFAPFPFVTDPPADSSQPVPREPVTHLGTDFGWMGPARHRITWRDGRAPTCAASRAGRACGTAWRGWPATRTPPSTSCAVTRR